jgi:Lung seven transmembrane receptor
MKRALSRCLLVMVSLGWGVTRDTLGAAMKRIVALGVVYVGVSTARDIMTVIAVNDVQKLSINEENELISMVAILSLVIAAIDVVFVLWILDALNNTMEDLEATNQRMKLKRYLQLRCLLLFAILFAVIWIMFGLVDTYMEESILEEQNQWVVLAAMELNFLMVLVGVVVLWKPNPRAKEFAFIMELPAMGGGDDDEHGEVNTGVIPSALDDDDLALKENDGGFKDKPANNRMHVENGVHT